MAESETILGAAASFNGTFKGGNILVEGTFEGELKVSEAVRIAQGSHVKAQIEADAVEIGGRFEGDVRTGSLRLLGPARASGKFRAGSMSIEEGGELDGEFEIGDDAPSRLVRQTV